MMGYGDVAGYGWIWMAAGVAFWGLVIAFLVYGFGRVTGRPPVTTESASTAEDILRRRLAQGEIDAAEYEARRRVIRG